MAELLKDLTIFCMIGVALFVTYQVAYDKGRDSMKQKYEFSKVPGAFMVKK